MKSSIAIAVALATVISLAAFPTLTGIRTSAQIPAQLPANMPTIPPATTNGDHLPVHTVQDDDHIVTVVTKHGEAPTGPIVIIPPGPAGGDNGTIITPGENITTGGGNVTNPGNPGNITIIEPGGNVTELPGNITNVGNDTVIIAPPDRNVTETPGNVTVIDPPKPPVVNETQPAPCSCQNQTNGQQPPTQTIPPVVIQPAPGQNVTQLPAEQPSGSNQTQPANPNPPSGNESGQQPTPPANNGTAGSGTNQTSNTGGNETQTSPINNATNSNSTNNEPPHATQLPASITSPFLPGIHVSSISYNGVNNQYLHK